MPLDRVTPADIPSQQQMIADSLKRSAARQQVLAYTGLRKAQLLKDYAWKTGNEDTLQSNANAVAIITGMVSTMLGPKGLDKMVVKEIGGVRPTRKVTITNDSAEFLSLLEFEHPVGKLLVDAAKTVDGEVGDGVASTFVLIGALLSEALKLRRLGLHPAVIGRGYEMACRKALKALEGISLEVGNGDAALLGQVATTAISGKGVAAFAAKLSSLVVDLALEMRRVPRADLSKVEVYRMPGNISDTSLIRGVVIRNEMASRGMPRVIKDARIATLFTPIVFRDMERSPSYDEVVFNFTKPEEMKNYADSRNRVVSDLAEKVGRAGANVLCTRKGLDEAAVARLESLGIAAVRRIGDEDVQRIASATGAKVVSGVNNLTADDVGTADLVEEVWSENGNWIMFEGCKNPASISVLLKSPSEEMTFEVEHLMKNAISTIRNVLRNGRVLPGGGVTHLSLASSLRRNSRSTGSREAFAVESFANALEEVPSTLAKNAGLDSLTTLTRLRAAHSNGPTRLGMDVRTGEVCDMVERGVLDPLDVVRQSLITATEFTKAILRLDLIIFTPTTQEEQIRKKQLERAERGKRPEDWVEEKTV